jgi:hypothetical protein
MGLLTGDPLQAVPVSSSTEEVLPDWYTNYAMQVLSNQKALAANPYPLYVGPDNKPIPRVADFTPTQQQAFQQTQDASTAYQPALQAATQATAAYDPYSGLQAAQPYLQYAGQTTPGVLNQYMNPYINDVVSQIGEQGARTLQEQILPSIRDKFIAGGGYGGSRNAEIFGRAVRDATQQITNQQAQAMQQGYSQAQSAASSDLSRLGALGATTAGLYGSAGAQQLGQASQLAGLGAQTQQLGMTGAGALGQVGAQQQALNQQNLTQAYQDFLTQQQYPQQQQQNMIAALQGVAPAVPKSAIEQGTQVPSTYQPSTLQQIASVVGAATGIGKLV